MTAQTRQPNPCNNMNHRRSNAPVGYCPQCGGVVNRSIRAQPCTETRHAAARRDQTVFCVDCGAQLIFSR